jgi:serine/threonine protein kinase
MPWLVMELLEGQDLAELVASQGPLAPAQVATIFHQLGHALGAAHQAGVVHRDLKPENLFLARSRRADRSLAVRCTTVTAPVFMRAKAPAPPPPVPPAVLAAARSA